jgi:hypothetical protein
MNRGISYILARLAEKNTWAGLAAAAAGLGILIKPELWESLTALGMAAAGLGLALSKDAPPTPPPPKP